MNEILRQLSHWHEAEVDLKDEEPSPPGQTVNKGTKIVIDGMHGFEGTPEWSKFNLRNKSTGAYDTE